jgi:hypothetical protein
MVQQKTAIDWISATSTKNGVAYAWYDLYRAKAKEYYDQAKESDWSALGFHGRQLQGPNMKWGWRDYDKRCIVIASGAMAHEVWDSLVPVAENVSRFDLACTVEVDQPGLAKEIYEKLTRSQARERYYTLFDRKGYPPTLYFGSRNSDQYGRLYHKSTEMGDPGGNLWRWEVELSGARSKPVAGELYESFLAGQPLADKISSYVWGWFDARHARPPWVPGGELWKVQPEAAKTTAEKKIAWLRNQVGPSLDWLFEIGRGDEALVALGIRPDLAARLAKLESEYRTRDRGKRQSDPETAIRDTESTIRDTEPIG